jgi:hypothetical protein
LAESFSKENEKKPFKLKNCDTLIVSLGKGIIVTNEAEADYVLVGVSDKQRRPGKKVISWNHFIDMIPGIEAGDVPEFTTVSATTVSSPSKSDKKIVRFDDNKQVEQPSEPMNTAREDSNQQPKRKLDAEVGQESVKSRSRVVRSQ